MPNRKRNKGAIVLASLVLCLVAPVLAADTSQWTNHQSLKPGDRIGVIQSDQKRVEGRFVSASDSGIKIQADQEIAIAKENVVRVYRRPRTSRLMRTLIGAGIGLAAGAIINATVGERFRNEGGDITAGSLAGGAAAGAAIGAASGGGYRTVYQREKN